MRFFSKQAILHEEIAGISVIFFFFAPYDHYSPTTATVAIFFKLIKGLYCGWFCWMEKRSSYFSDSFCSESMLLKLTLWKQYWDSGRKVEFVSSMISLIAPFLSKPIRRWHEKCIYSDRNLPVLIHFHSIEHPRPSTKTNSYLLYQKTLSQKTASWTSISRLLDSSIFKMCV